MAGQTIIVSVLADTAKFGKGFRDAAGDASSFGSKVGGIGKLVAAGLVVGGAAVVALGKKVTDLASDQQQALGGLEAVFGKFTGSTNKWMESSTTQFGLSKTETASLATLIGSQLKTIGIHGQALGDKTKDILTQGADFAATYGGKTSDAVAAISSALKGEFDPIEKYGITLNAATVQQYALAHNMDMSTVAAQNQAKKMATIAVIHQQGADATGQWAKQQNTLAEQQQIFTAKVSDFGAKVGTIFLPVISAVMVKMNAFLDTLSNSDAFNGFLTSLAAMAENLAKGNLPSFVTDLISVGTEASPVAALIRVLAANIGTLLPVFVQVGQVIAQGLVAILPTLLTLAGSLGSVFEQVFTALLPVAVALIKQLATVFGQLIGPITAIVSAVGGALSQVFATLAPVLAQVAGVLGNVLLVVFKALSPILVIVATALGQVLTALSPILGPIAQIAGALASALMPVISALLPLVTTVFAAITPIIQGLATIIAGVVKVIVSLLTGDFGGALQGLKQIFSGVIQTIGGIFTGLISIIGGVVKAVLAIFAVIGRGILSAIGNLGSLLIGVGGDLLGGMVSGITTGFRAVDNFFGNVPSKVLGALGGLGSTLLSKGRDLLDGLGNGIDNGWSPVSNFFGNLATKVVSAVGGVASTLVDKGRDLLDGLRAGIDARIDSALNVFSSLKSKVVAAVGDAGSMLLDIGGYIVAGLRSGISSAWGSVTSLVQGLTDKLPLIVRKALGIASPSKVFAWIGQWIPAGLSQGITGGISGVNDAMGKLTDAISRAVDMDGFTKAQGKAAESIVDGVGDKLKGIASDREQVSTRLEKANDRLAAIRDTAAQLASSVSESSVALGNVATTYGNNQTNGTTTTSTAGVKDAVSRVKIFTAQIKQLRAWGMDDVTFQQLLSAFQQTGDLGASTDLINSGAGNIADLASQQGALATVAGKLGGYASQQLYGSGIAAANSVVQGLTADRDSLDAGAAELAAKLALKLGKWLKKEDLGSSGEALIKSFSKGIEDAADGAYDSAHEVLKKIRRLFPNSPAKAGPFSGKGYTDRSGKALMTGFASGILSQGAKVRAATASVMEGAAGAVSASGAAFTSSGTLQGGNHYTVNLSTLNPGPEVGRLVVESINDYERLNGPR